MTPREDTPWCRLTKEEQNILRLWFAIGLPIEMRCNNPWQGIKLDHAKDKIEDFPAWCFRLKRP